MSTFTPGTTIQLNDGRVGTVRFFGPTSFSAGDWVGVELAEPSGKNDGSVQGKRYFDVRPNYGMFVKPGVAKLLQSTTTTTTSEQDGGDEEQEKEKEATPKAAVKSAGSRASFAPAGRRQTSVASTGTVFRKPAVPVSDATIKRGSLNADSPTPGARPPSAAARAMKSPSRSSFARQSISNSTSSTSLAPRAARPSLVAPTKSSTSAVSRTSRTSLAPSAALKPQVRPANGRPTPRIPIRPASAAPEDARTESETASQNEAHLQDVDVVSTTQSENQAGSVSEVDVSTRDSSTTKTTPSPETKPLQSQQTPRPPAMSVAYTREIEDLKSKLKILEKKRVEDRDKLKGMETTKAERDKFEGIIQRLQAKIQPQSQEIARLKTQLEQAEKNSKERESSEMDVDAAVEMATLDREMAEEIADSLRHELETLRQKQQEMELELEILREENAEYGKEISPEARESQSFMHLEMTNERLREALVRLRDLSQDTEAELKAQISELDTDLEQLKDVKSTKDELDVKLTQEKALTEDLKAQLDAALGAEDMIEELTEKNMNLNEQVQSLKEAVDDLESLKEISDELEQNHIEAERELLQELDDAAMAAHEAAQKSAKQDTTIDELQYTVTRYQDLITTLRYDIEDLRRQQADTELQASDLDSKSRAMMDLNLKLQSSAAKAQVKVIEVELGRLDAQESKDHLSIVTPFLPETYTSYKASVNSYLRVRRIGFKADLTRKLLEEKLAGAAMSGREEHVFVGCHALDMLTWTTGTMGRFTAFIRAATPETFVKLESVAYELEPVERSFNTWIDQLRRDELRELHVESELVRAIALMTHLADRYIEDSPADGAALLDARIRVMTSSIQSAALAVSQIKAITQARVLLPTDADEKDEQEAATFLQKADDSIKLIQSAKVIAGKSLQGLSSLSAKSSTLDSTATSTVDDVCASAETLAKQARDAGLRIAKLMNEDIALSVSYGAITAQLENDSDSDVPIPFTYLSRLTTSTTSHLAALNTTLSTPSSHISLPAQSNPPPWTLLARKLASETISPSHFASEIARLTDTIAERSTALAFKERTISDQSVSIEVLEKRAGETEARKDRLRELEDVATNAEKMQSNFTSQIAKLEAQLASAKAESESLKEQVGRERAPNADDTFVSKNAHLRIEALEIEVHALQKALLYFRSSISSSADADADFSFLSAPLLPRHVSTQSERSKAHLARQAKAVVSTMRDIVSSSSADTDNAFARGTYLLSRTSEQRVAWRPKAQDLRYKVRDMKSTWGEWTAWRDGVVREISRAEKRAGRGMKGGDNMEMGMVYVLGREEKLQSATVEVVV